MDKNLNNINQDKLNDLLKFASKKLGTSEENLKNLSNNGNIENTVKNLKGVDMNKFNSIMNDPKKLEDVLNSPQAKNLLSKLMEGKK
ncbi:MAG: hypothetical protein RR048_04020 [Oscillospiraceae bacterium]